MKQSSFPPTVKEPQDQLLCSSTAGVTPPSSVLSSLLSQMTWFVFLFFVFKSSLFLLVCTMNTAITDRKVYTATREMVE